MVDRNKLDEIRNLLVIVLFNRNQFEVPTFAVPSQESFISVGVLPQNNINGRKRSNGTTSNDGAPPVSPLKYSPAYKSATGTANPSSLIPTGGLGLLYLFSPSLPNIPVKKACKARKSKSTNSSDYQTQSFSLLPMTSLPSSFSAPLPPSPTTNIPLPCAYARPHALRH